MSDAPIPTVVSGNCNNCMYYVPRPDKFKDFGDCLNSLITEHASGDEHNNARGLWSFEALQIGKDFGCIHWESK